MTQYRGRIVPEGAPHFLIVGACKAGTTTLYDDLAMHPNAGMPSDKEPDVLHRASDACAALELWRRHFKGINPTFVRGEGSTYYTMQPDFSDVSNKARDALGPHARIVYIMRHPIRRIESHLAHDFAVGRLQSNDFDSAALDVDRYVDWSDYGRQIKPWITAFGRHNVLPVIFENFVKARHYTAKSVAAFVGLDPDQLPPREAVSNVRGSQRVSRSTLLSTFMSGSFYRQFVRPAMPESLRSLARNSLMHAHKAPQFSLSPATVAELERRLNHVGTDLHALAIEPGHW